MKDCHVCKRLEDSSTPFRPPALPYRPLIRPPKLIEGTWASTRCEVQRYGLFLTRKLTFRSSRPRWNIKQRYFYDPHCRNATYTILASGNYKKVLSPEKILPENFQGDAFDMTVRKMSIIPEDKIFAGQLNRLPGRACGIQGRWRKGKVQDVTLTGGCFPIGLKVPSIEPEILRFESGDKGEVYLTLGQTPTWPYKGKGMAPRPTSWGPKLLKCNDVPQTNEILKPIVGARVALNEGTVVYNEINPYLLLSIFLITLIMKI
ncbi:Protein APCDD1 [Armadillidium vulgare]|nr:Protein APCDD1 [Armadillidium vulgare]